MTVRDHPVNKQNYGAGRIFSIIFLFFLGLFDLFLFLFLTIPELTLIREELFMKKTRILSISAVITAIYVVVMYFTQSFAFGAYQIRIATCLYSLSYFFPFLIFPLGFANFLSNFFFGGLGIIDIIGGTLVGIITSGGVYFIRKFRLSALFIISIIILGPGLIVPIWLSYLLKLPYSALALSLCIGQIVPAVAGYFLIKILGQIGVEKLWNQNQSEL